MLFYLNSQNIKRNKDNYKGMNCDDDDSVMLMILWCYSSCEHHKLMSYHFGYLFEHEIKLKMNRCNRSIKAMKIVRRNENRITEMNENETRMFVM